MKVCIISPINYLTDFSILGDAEMSLAHLVLTNDQYRDYYASQVKKNKFVILDNGAFEKEQIGKGLEPEDVLEAQKMIGAQEVICTDVLCNGEKTIEKTLEFIDVVDKKGMLGKIKLQAVVQGNTKEEWFFCYKKFLKIKKINCIGLSKISVPKCFLGTREESGCVARARLLCIQEIIQKELMPHFHEKTIHCLGSDNWMGFELSSHKRYEWIRSMDSSAPVWYGHHGHEFDEKGKIENIITEKPILEGNIELQNKGKIFKNIAMIHKLSKREK